MKPGEDVDVTFVVDEKFSDARLTFARSNMQRRQTILHKIYVGPYTNISQLYGINATNSEEDNYSIHSMHNIIMHFITTRKCGIVMRSVASVCVCLSVLLGL